MSEQPSHHIVSALVENKFGVLARISSLFARRGRGSWTGTSAGAALLGDALPVAAEVHDGRRILLDPTAKVLDPRRERGPQVELVALAREPHLELDGLALLVHLEISRPGWVRADVHGRMCGCVCVVLLSSRVVHSIFYSFSQRRRSQR